MINFIIHEINQNLKNCANSINNSSFRKIVNKNKVNIIDVYNLREDYQESIVNNCLVNNLSWLVLDNNGINSSFLNTNRYLIDKHISLLSNSTSYLKKDLLNNSSYYYNTNIASSSLKNNSKDGFYEVMDAYNAATDFILYMSNWYKMEVEG